MRSLIHLAMCALNLRTKMFRIERPKCGQIYQNEDYEKYLDILLKDGTIRLCTSKIFKE